MANLIVAAFPSRLSRYSILRQIEPNPRDSGEIPT
jgi:hypothetical protein